MTPITTRAGKGSELTWGEVDSNFENLQAAANDYDDAGFDVVLCAGQSNMAGRATIDSFADYIDSRVFQYGIYSTDTATFQKIGPMTEPLKGADTTLASGRTGPAPWLGRALASMVPSNRRILLVNAAVGGTSVVGGTPTWNAGTPGGTNYENAIARTNAAITAAQLVYPNSRFVGVAWIQGETDGDNSVSQAAYQAALTAVVSGFRSRITGASSSWFVIGGMVPEAIAANAGYPAIRDAHIAVAAAVARCEYVPGVSGYTSDNLHYNVQPGPRIVGYQMAAASRVASGDAIASPPANVVVPAISGTEQDGQTLTATSGTWTNSPTVYAYQWRRGGVDISGATSVTYVLVTADVGSTLTVVVTASNGAGSNSATSAATGTIAASGYTFEGDTVGAAPAGITVRSTGFSTMTPVVRDSGAPAGMTGKYLTSAAGLTPTTNGTLAWTLGNFASSADQRVTWKRGKTAGARDGMLLRAQGSGSSYTQTAEYNNMRAGYHFQASGSNGSLRIYRFSLDGLSVTQLGSTFTLADADVRYFRASVIGSALLFEYSADGIAWTTAISLTDGTITAAGGVDYLAGFSAGNQNAVYIDNISYEAL